MRTTGQELRSATGTDRVTESVPQREPTIVRVQGPIIAQLPWSYTDAGLAGPRQKHARATCWSAPMTEPGLCACVSLPSPPPHDGLPASISATRSLHTLYADPINEVSQSVTVGAHRWSVQVKKDVSFFPTPQHTTPHHKHTLTSSSTQQYTMDFVKNFAAEQLQKQRECNPLSFGHVTAVPRLLRFSAAFYLGHRIRMAIRTMAHILHDLH